MNDNEIGKEIKRMRERRGLTITQLADECHVSQPFISQIEAGKRKPSADVVKKISNVLGTRVSKLLHLAGHLSDEEYLESLNMEVMVVEKRIQTLEAARQEENDSKNPFSTEEERELQVLRSLNEYLRLTIHKLQIEIGREVQKKDYYDSFAKDVFHERYIKFKVITDPQKYDSMLSEEELKREFLNLENLFTMEDDIYLNDQPLTKSQKDMALKILKLIFQKEESDLIGQHSTARR